MVFGNSKRSCKCSGRQEIAKAFYTHRALGGKVHLHAILISQIMYPDFQFVHGQFKVAPPSTWKNREKTREFLVSLEPKLGILTREDDWYRVSKEQVGCQLLRLII